MLRIIICMALWSAAVLPLPASAQPVTLKLAFFTSDREVNWVGVFKPFIDAVNADRSGALRIEGYPNGALGRNLPQQPQMVLDGVADIAFSVPSLSAGRFPDDVLFELPGLVSNLTEGTRLYEALLGSNSMRGYSDYVVLGSYMNVNLNIFSRRPIKSLKDLKGVKVRILGPVVAQTAKEFGMVPVLMPPNEAVEAIGRGTVDAVITVPAALVDFGIDRVTQHDYMIHLGTNSFAVLMSRAKFESMPKPAQAVLRKYSGRWINDRHIKEMTAYNQALLDRFKADPKRAVVLPSAEDLKRASAAFENVAKDWAAKDPRNAELLKKAREILARERAGKKSR